MKKVLTVLALAASFTGVSSVALASPSQETQTLTHASQFLTPYKGVDGNWFIGSLDTGVPHRMSALWLEPYKGSDGHWFIGQVDTGVSHRKALSLHVKFGTYFIGHVNTEVPVA